MSPRAAWRLEGLGFTDVYIYAGGKEDWGAAGLPMEGDNERTVAELVRRDVPTCDLDEPVAAVQARVRASRWDTCFVVTPGRVVLGRLHHDELERAGRAGEVMRPGPSTFRPNVSVGQMLRYMKRLELSTAPITTNDGVLVGLVLRKDLEAA